MPFNLYASFDSLYMLLVLPAFVFSLLMQFLVNSTFKKYSKVQTRRGITGAEAAERVLRSKGIYGVKIERVAGSLTDHYDPRSNTIRLSDSVYSNKSVAAVSVAAHEAGHAAQYAENYSPVKIRTAIIPVTNIGSMLSVPLILIGLAVEMGGLINIGLLLFGAVVLFQLITLPVEFNASARAKAALSSSGVLGGDELSATNKVLGAAALTYVAALAVSAAQLIRLIVIANKRR